VKLAIVGVGKMGLALLEGLTRRDVLPAGEIGLLDANVTRAAELAERFGARVIRQSELARAQRVVLALQPRTFPSVIEQIAQPNVGYVSTMAGVSVATLSRRLGTKRVVRVMPSLAATIGKAQTAVAAPREAVEAGDLDFARMIFGAVGDVYELPEHLFNVFTGMSASGPAYAAVFAEALADGAVRMGLSRALAHELAAKLLVASGELLLQRPHPGLLKDEVASPGGTTIAGLAEIERGALRSAVIDAVVAATRRGTELGKDED